MPQPETSAGRVSARSGADRNRPCPGDGPDRASAPPADLRRLVERAVVGTVTDADWTALRGGRANRVWRIATPSGDAIVKVYSRQAACRLFPNHPAAEARVLRALAGTGLAPDPLFRGRYRDGPVLVYRAVPGPTLAERGTAAGIGGLATLLARLHRLAPPTRFRPVGLTARALRRGISADLAAAPDGPLARVIARSARRPTPRLPGAGVRSLLHGDPVPGNVVCGPGDAVTLIDWQCPALGDPVHDLALVLSPGMRRLYACPPLSDAERGRFWRGYGDSAAAARHAALLPLLSARIAAHCLAQAARGRPGYAAAATAEVTALQELEE